MTPYPQATSRHLVVLLVLMLASSSAADDGRLRVGTSGDYPPFSSADPSTASGYEGFEIALAKRYAAERGLEIEWLRFRWPKLLQDLAAGRFDVAMSGITLRPERSLVGRFSIATAESGAVALVVDPNTYPTLAALDTPRARIGVNAGGHLERVAAEHFPRATRIAIPDNRAVLEALIRGQLSAAVSDTHEAALWERELPGSTRLGPFTRDRKAWLLAAERAELAADMDAWLLAREADGSLEALRRAELHQSGPLSASPLRALCAALDERLSLMPWVALAKRRRGLPLEVPEREARVVVAALAAVDAAARQAGRPAPPRATVEDFFRAQFEAAKQVQRATLDDPGPRAGGSVPDLQTQLRPALLRIGERMARLIVALPATGLDPAEALALLREEVRVPELSPASRQGLAAALVALTETTGAQPSDGSPARSRLSAEPARNQSI